jgi:hypothetical protein
MVQATDDTSASEDDVVVPLRPDAQTRLKDPTSATRSKRYRRARKQGGKRNGRTTARLPNRDGKSAPGEQAPKAEKQNEIKAGVTVHVAPPLAPDIAAYTSSQRHGRGIRFATLTAALALATVSAGFSITGLTSVFVGAFWPVIGMGVALELGKLSAVAWLGRAGCTGEGACHPARPLKAAIVTLIALLMGLNAVGAYGFLAKAHIGHQVEGDVAVAGRSADVEGRISMQVGMVADLTKQIADLDAARTIEAPSAGNLRTASATAKLRAADDERRQAKRTSLADKLTVEAKALADLKIEKAKVDGERKVAEADLGPVRYLATLFGAGDQDVLRWFILVVALLLDPAAVLILLAATRR